MSRLSLGTRVARTALGAVGGVAWACALRAWMAELSGPMSQFSWGTFLGVLLPGLVVGAAVGWATTVGADATARERRMLRWCAVAPLAFAVAPLLLPGALVGLLTEGLGGGAVLVALTAVAGGYAFGGGRPTWARVVCGVAVVAICLAGAFTGSMFRPAALALGTPRGAWLAVLDLTLMVVLVAAASIPFRRLTAVRRAARPVVENSRRPALTPSGAGTDPDPRAGA
ncbi:hypothetical protein FLP10_04845 [Agromyces intestinalis]|uniref:Uncharacterized protein n=1 Tax=Agromyces intestinalis TaxID=2592652 RepID=A0A5C1YCK6_9MICO|nr:hypothetical protein [Agromyces intestinalis]QEO13823.1 hypothetical protein FLP10_04845 [Agromyces intestinalis]